MNFKIIEYNIPTLEQINTPEGRFYESPTGERYPSVTTVLGRAGNSYLTDWINKVGEVEAKKISSAAARRGTLIHESAENYIRGLPVFIHPYLQTERNMYEALIPELNKFDEVHALETRLYSDKLRVAGTVDCIAKIDGKFWIIDFKTSRRYKTEKEIHSYFMQCAAYSVCWYERTGILASDMRILMTTEDDGVLVFEQPVKPWIAPFIELRKLC